MSTICRSKANKVERGGEERCVGDWKRQKEIEKKKKH